MNGKWFLLLVFAMLGSGCVSYGEIRNTHKNLAQQSPTYSLQSYAERFSDTDNSVTLAFSGGGARAAALSYGVLLGLRDTKLPQTGKLKTMLDEVDIISSVSGGSFTAAYYGVYGDEIFNSFESKFLRRNIESKLISGLFNPLNWFSRIGRSQRATDYFDLNIFDQATFADMLRPGMPIIIINATDLGRGVRFSFTQEYFDLLCSDLSDFPVAAAVMASSAVPFLASSVVIANYDDCVNHALPWFKAAEIRGQQEPEIKLTVKGLKSYNDKQQRKFIHMVDGGITDNLGLRAIIDVTELTGGMKSLQTALPVKPVKRSVIIAVDASAQPSLNIDLSDRQPSIAETVHAVSETQLNHYNAGTVALIQAKQKQWAEELSTPAHKVDTYFINLAFDAVPNAETRKRLNQITTSLYLSRADVDLLIETGQSLLKKNPEYQRLLQDMRN